jgi:hypothetical protein
MTWNDFLVDRVLNHQEVAAGVAFMFGIDAGQVLVLADILDAPRSSVVCVVRPVEGDFRMMVEVYVNRESLADLPVLPAMVKFARLLGCRCLTSDDSPNPYLWALVEPSGGTKQAALDAGELDDNDRYVLLR